MKTKSEIVFEPDQTASEAVRQILRVLLTALQAPIAGTLEGMDPEPLHDLRVANRRTRTVIGQLKRAVPPIAMIRFAPDFKWLGDITGPCRDLDVWLMDLVARRANLKGADADALVPLESLVRASRGRAHAEVVRGVGSERFSRLLSDWQVFLSEWPLDSDPPPDGEIPAPIFAERRILKAFNRVKRRGRELGEHPQALPLHQLRLAAKKLRYLLEFFRSLDRRGDIAARIKELKALQNVLGELNDLEFQRARLTAHSQKLKDPSTGETHLSVRQLGSEIDHRRGELRREVYGRLEPVIRKSPPVCFTSLH